MFRAKFERVQPYDFGALALRLIISTDFLTSGWSTVKDPVGRGKLNGLPPAFMMFIGVAELAGSAGLIFGVLARWAALGLMLIMAGAIQKKIFVWHTGFWGKDGYGWHYDLTLVTMNLMIALAGPGQLSLLP
jgi:putative oxidoreductase